MLALVYLVLMMGLGDAICRTFLPPLSRVHRVSSAFLVGLVVSSWLTYLGALVMAGTDGPMAFANVLFAAVAIPAIALRWRHWRPGRPWGGGDANGELVDIALLSIAFLGTSLLMTSTFDVRDSTFFIGNTVYSDFGPTSAIMQSFAVGQNFPTEYPHFAGAPIRYHFLFYFGAGNLEFLGLDAAISLNLLSSASIVAMLAQLLALGRLLFGINAPGRIGAALFFAHGTLAWVPFVAQQPSLDAAISAVASRREFMASGFPWRGEEWGIWTLTVFTNQRHLASAIGLLLVVLVFVVARHRGWSAGPETPAAATESTGQRWRRRLAASVRDPWLPSFAVAGMLLGALPLWNGAVFLAAFFVMASLTVILPRRHLMLAMALAAAAVALPQLAFLRPYVGANAGYPALHWGYVIDDPSLTNVAAYLAFTFGLKIVLTAAALPFVDGLARRVLLAATVLLVVAFTLQLSVEVLANHKFINIWLIVLNLFAGYAIWLGWRSLVKDWPIASGVAVATAALIAVGGIIDLMPFKNGNQVGVPYRDDPLTAWVRSDTEPGDVFLTDIVVTSPILLNGRFLYLGWPYYAWSAGYPTPEREELYRQMYGATDADEALRLLQENGIDYVVWDDGVRTRGFVEQPNEEVFRQEFPVAFTDPAYAGWVIYEVPEAETAGGP